MGDTMIVNDNAIIFHIDVNSAYLSWSALRELQNGSTQDLRTIPSIVGGDQETRHGIVVAKSIPAKVFGIQTAETVASAFQKCPTLVMVPPDHAYYRDMSQKLMRHLRSICDEIEQVSIDECYMSFEPIRGRFPSPEAAATYIKDSVYDTFGFTVNVGISDRKVLAKMASDFKKPNLVHTLYVSEIQKKLWPLPIASLHMCGKSSAKLLQKMGIRTIGDLARTDKAVVESWLKSHGGMLWNYANGIDDGQVVKEKPKAKGVGNSTTLANNAETEEEAYTVLKELAVSVSQRLKKHHFLAAQISTEIKYASFRSVSHQTTILTPTAEETEIYQCACQLFNELWDGEPIRLLGIRTTKLQDEEEPTQISLFDLGKYQEQEKQEELRREKEEQKQKKLASLDDAIAKIKKRYGDNAIHKGAETK
ncbi:DNA polymerase Y family protein [Eubacterium ramulus]|jgi:DNA polymerase-4|uniref:DNA polymerase Y family protein n=1 Tax=Eubacterium ramulus TaxID=39490 RepID=UPI0022E641DA|nr:DNA polymerase IV [Eubacterium ramulus]